MFFLGGQQGCKAWGSPGRGCARGLPPPWAEGGQNWPAGPPAALSPSICPSSCASPGLPHHTGCSPSRALPRAPGSLGVRRPWLRSQPGPLRAARSREAALLHRAHLFIVHKTNRNKAPFTCAHVGWAEAGIRGVWNARVSCSPPLFIHLHPAAALCVHGRRCPDRHPILLSRGRAGGRRRGVPTHALPSCSEGALAPTAHWARPLETPPLHLAVIGAHGRADRHRGQRMLGE